MKNWNTSAFKRVVSVLAGSAVMLVSFGALAQMDAEMQAAVDKYSVVSEQKLMLTGKVNTQLPADMQKMFMFEAGFGRFDSSVSGATPQESTVGTWCRAQVKDMQVRRGEVDDEVMEEAGGAEFASADVTLQALIERCSDVFSYDLKITVDCKKKVVPAGKKTKTVMECTVEDTVTFTKFAADQSSGTLKWGVDKSWQDKGKMVVTKKETASSEIKKGNVAAAKERALKTATFMAAMWTKRDMLEAKEFRSTAPIIAVNGGTAYSCLNKKVTELDLPYYIVIKTEEGEKEMGFAKTRKFYDGCTETPSLAKAAAKGEKVELLPAEAQVILGAPQPGYTLSEMPSVGLNVGAGGGITGSFDFAHAPVASIIGEFNLAKYTGVSELHAFGRLNLGFGLKEGFFGVTEKINTIIANNSTGITGLLSDDSDFNLLAGLDLGILKRFYAHAFFFEVGVAVSTTAYLLETAPGFENWTAMIIGIAGLPHVGFGFQLSPRFMMRFMAGFKAGVSYLLLTETVTGLDYSAFLTDTAAMELGVVGGFHILYNI